MPGFGPPGVAPPGVGPFLGPLAGEGNPLVLRIAGTVYTSYVVKSLKIKDSLSARSTCQFTIVDFDGAYTFNLGQEVTVEYASDRLFGGRISKVKEKNPQEMDGSTFRFHQVVCTDWTALCDRFVVGWVYENQTLNQIVNDIVNTRTPLSEEGINVKQCAGNDINIDKITYSYDTVSEIFRELSDMSGLYWNVDGYKDLTFVDSTTYDAPYNIGDSGIGGYRDLTYTRELKRYRNRQIFRAGWAQTSQKVETFKGDYTTVTPENRRRTFTTKYPIASAPTINRGAVAQRIGIRELDIDGDLTIANWAQWFWQKESNEISQNSANDQTNNPTLTNEETLEVTYIGLYPMVIIDRNEAQIEERQAIEGGSGRYDWYDEEEELDSRELAEYKTEKLLSIYGDVTGTLDYKVFQYGLKPGHLQTITLGLHNISATQFLIDSVSITFLTDGDPVYKIRALNSGKQDGWADFFRRWAKRGKRFVSREKEVVDLWQRKVETIAFTDTCTDSYNGSPPSLDVDDDPYNSTRVGTMTISGTGEKVPRGRIGATRLKNVS